MSNQTTHENRSDEIKAIMESMGFVDVTGLGDMRLDDCWIQRRAIKTPHDLCIALINWGREDGASTLAKSIRAALRISQ